MPASGRMTKKYFPPQFGQSDLLIRHLYSGSDQLSTLAAFCKRGLSIFLKNIEDTAPA